MGGKFIFLLFFPSHCSCITQRKRESATTKMYDEYEKKWYRYEGYMDRLERRANARSFQPSQDCQYSAYLKLITVLTLLSDTPTYAIESLYDELEDPVQAAQLCSTLDATQSGLLAQHIKQQLNVEKGSASERIREEVDVRIFLFMRTPAKSD